MPAGVGCSTRPSRHCSSFAAVAQERDRVAAAVHALAAIFRQPRLEVAFDLYAAARTDAELHAALAPVLARHRQNLHREARALFPEVADADSFLPVGQAEGMSTNPRPSPRVPSLT